MTKPSEQPNPYDNLDTSLWKHERRIHKVETELDYIDARFERIESRINEERNRVFNYSLFFICSIMVASTLFSILFKSIGQARDKTTTNRNSTIRFKGVYSCGIIFLSCEANSMKKRSEQQMIDPYDVPREDSEVYTVEEEDNITEEVELTLEELKRAYNLTAEELKKIWADHRGKQNNGQHEHQTTERPKLPYGDAGYSRQESRWRDQVLH